MGGLGAKVNAGNGAGLADLTARCWLRAISCRIGCVGLGLLSTGRSAPGLNLNSGRGRGLADRRLESEAIGLTSGLPLSVGVASELGASSSAGLNRKGGRIAGALGLRDGRLRWG